MAKLISNNEVKNQKFPYQDVAFHIFFECEGWNEDREEFERIITPLTADDVAW